MRDFELKYGELIAAALKQPERTCRNGVTRAMFAPTLVINNYNGLIPLIQGRKMYPTGIIGEFAAFVRGPKKLADFEAFGCNYWKKWAKADGTIELDYGNAWLEGGQIDHVLNCLVNNPTDRRMLITGWRPSRLKELDLPCCHYAYQFFVREEAGEKYLDLLWHQRSTDLMVGLPSDIVLAYLWLVAFCRATPTAMYTPGRITMTLGDAHVYAAHYEAAQDYLARIKWGTMNSIPKFVYDAPQGMPVTLFSPSLCKVLNYDHLGPMPLEVL